MKVCSKCGKELTLDKFYKDKSRKDGLMSRCKECDGERYKKYISRKNFEKGIISKEKITPNEGMKICLKCGNELTFDKFCKDKGKEDGLCIYCKKCESKRHQKYKEKNKSKMSEQQKQYQQRNKETIAKKQKRYYQDNKIALLEYQKPYRQNNKNKLLEKRKQYYKGNKEKIEEHSKQYYEDNKGKIGERSRQYKKDNVEKYRMYNQNRRMLSHSLLATLTVEQWRQIKNDFNNRCCYCGKELPLQQEHFLALSKGGEYTVNNILPSCKSCNSSKRNKDFFKWYPKYKYYSKKREIKIIKYLRYKNNSQQLSLL